MNNKKDNISDNIVESSRKPIGLFRRLCVIYSFTWDFYMGRTFELAQKGSFCGYVSHRDKDKVYTVVLTGNGFIIEETPKTDIKGMLEKHIEANAKDAWEMGLYLQSDPVTTADNAQKIIENRAYLKTIVCAFERAKGMPVDDYLKEAFKKGATTIDREDAGRIGLLFGQRAALSSILDSSISIGQGSRAESRADAKDMKEITSSVAKTAQLKFMYSPSVNN